MELERLVLFAGGHQEFGSAVEFHDGPLELLSQACDVGIACFEFAADTARRLHPGRVRERRRRHRGWSADGIAAPEEPSGEDAKGTGNRQQRD